MKKKIAKTPPPNLTTKPLDPGDHARLVEMVAQHGEHGACASISLSRMGLARALAHFPLRIGTRTLIHVALAVAPKGAKR